MKALERQTLRREAYRIAVLMMGPALWGDVPLVEENDLDPTLLKQELQHISNALQKKAGVKEQSSVSTPIPTIRKKRDQLQRNA